MSKKKLVEMLQSLPISEPVVEQIRGLFPHLADEEIERLLLSNSKEGSYIVVPPLRVNGAYHTLYLSPGYKDEQAGEIKPVRLHWLFAKRTRASYKGSGGYGDSFDYDSYIERAVQYARENWGRDLVLDDWENFAQIHVEDPSDLIGSSSDIPPLLRGIPKTKAIVYFALNRGWNNIANNHSKPQSQLIDDAIVEITDNKFIASELKGGRAGYSERNCALDGAGLGLSGCGECGHRFRDNQLNNGWYTPLPSKVADFLMSQGYKFKQDPAIARKKEAQRFYQILPKGI